MNSSPNLNQMTPDQLRAFAVQLLSQVDTMGKRIHRVETVNAQRDLDPASTDEWA